MLNGNTAAYDCAKLKGVDVMVIGRNGLRSFYMLPALIQFLAQAVLISNHNAHSWVSQRLIEIGQLTIISISHVWILLLNTIPTLNGVNSEMCIRLKISTLAHWHTGTPPMIIGSFFSRFPHWCGLFGLLNQPTITPPIIINSFFSRFSLWCGLFGLMTQPQAIAMVDASCYFDVRILNASISQWVISDRYYRKHQSVVYLEDKPRYFTKWQMLHR